MCIVIALAMGWGPIYTRTPGAFPGVIDLVMRVRSHKCYTAFAWAHGSQGTSVPQCSQGGLSFLLYIALIDVKIRLN